jgi:hypothetical protein
MCTKYLLASKQSKLFSSIATKDTKKPAPPLGLLLTAGRVNMLSRPETGKTGMLKLFVYDHIDSILFNC